MKAIVKEIQVGGNHCVKSLEEACWEFTEMVTHSKDTGYRAKLNFTIKLPDGKIKSITIRDEDDETVAYGDLAGLPSFLDYSKEVVGNK
jgi:hypothetical protein